MADHGCDDDLLAGPGASDTARQVGADGFAALWRGRRPAITDLTHDAATVAALVAAGRLELDEHGILIGVHGIAARPTAHRIEHAAGVAHTWCALDAIGIPAALAIDATAVTACPTCGLELRVTLHDGVPDDTGTRRLWFPGGPCTHLVEDFCRHANLYCNPEHLQAALPAGATGRTVTIADAAAIGRTSWHDVAMILQTEEKQRS